MKKKTLFVSILALSAIFGLNSCTSGKKTTSSNSAAPSTVETTTSANSENSQAPNTSAAENVKTFKSAAVDASGAKVEYKPGETFSTEGVKIVLTYSNTLTDDTTEDVTDLTGYDVSIKDSDNNAVEEIFALGEYTVTLAKDNVSASYKINVVKESFTIESVSDAIEVGKDHVNFVTGGSFEKKTDYDAAPGEEPYHSSEKYNFTFGQNFFMSEQLEQGKPFLTKIIEDLGDDEYSSIEKYSEGAYSKSFDSVDEEDMKGLKVQPFDHHDYYTVFKGAEDTVSGLYELGSQLDSFEEQIIPATEDAAAKYKYSFTYVTEDDTTFGIEVTFELNEYGILSKADTIITEGSYTYSFLFNQNAGLKNTPNPAPMSSLAVSSLTLKDPQGNDVTSSSSFTIGVKQSLYLSVTDITPDTASLFIDKFTYFVDDVEIDEYNWSPDVYFSYSESSGIYISPNKAGEYNVKIATQNWNVTFKIVAELTDPTVIDPQIYNEDWQSFSAAQSKEKVLVNTPIKIKGKINDGAKVEYTAAFTTATNKATLTYNEADNSYTFVATETGNYEVTFTASNGNNVTCTLTLNVIDKPNPEELFDGTWYDKEGSDSTVTFLPNFNPSTGSATFTIVNYGTKTSTYNYSIVNGEVTFEFVSGDEYLNPEYSSKDGSISCNYGWQKFTVDAEDPASKVIELVVGDNYNLSVDYMGTSFPFTAPAAGTYEFSISSYNGVVSLQDPTSEGEVTSFVITLAEGQQLNITAYAEDNGKIATITIIKYLSLGDNDLSASIWGMPFTFVAEEAGTYVFDSTSPAYLGYAEGNGYDVEGQRYEVTLEAGQKIVVTFFGNGVGYDSADFTVTITKAE